MKLFFRLGLVAMMALTMTVTSCNKYEEGPKVTLLTAKMRITGDWSLLNVTADGYDVTSFYPTTSLEIVKDGTYKYTATSGSVSVTENGSWKFNSDKTQYISTDSDGDITTYTIVKLKNSILKLKYVDSDGDVTIYTYEQ